MEHSDEQAGDVSAVRSTEGDTQVVAHSSVMQTVLKRAARFARSSAPVAIFGETGTGKEVVARVLHANSPRARAPFVAVNVAALPAEVLESELFGHGAGATVRPGLFDAADGGTLFLDEIGEMPLTLQAKLLRVLQDGELRRTGQDEPFAVDVRVLCATHGDLGQRVREGAFREDLFYRLKVLSLHVPALRARSEDIIPLARRFLADERTAAGRFSRAAENRLLAYPWPGNVRELQNAVKHGAALAAGNVVGEDDLPDEVRLGSPGPTESVAPKPGALRTLADTEREHILRVLDACNGSQSEAAQVLGIGRNTLWRKLRSYV